MTPDLSKSSSDVDLATLSDRYIYVDSEHAKNFWNCQIFAKLSALVFSKTR